MTTLDSDGRCWISAATVNPDDGAVPGFDAALGDKPLSEKVSHLLVRTVRHDGSRDLLELLGAKALTFLPRHRATSDHASPPIVQE